MDDFGSGSLATIIIDFELSNKPIRQASEIDETIYFESYQDYLKSDEWKEKANAAKERAGWQCQINAKHSNKILHAHHRTYERIGNELDSDITVLCDSCHRKAHNKEFDV